MVLWIKEITRHTFVVDLSLKAAHRILNAKQVGLDSDMDSRPKKCNQGGKVWSGNYVHWHKQQIAPYPGKLTTICCVLSK